MKTLVVGAKGVLGSALVELLISLSHQVSCVDVDTVEQLPEIAESQNVAFIAVPISQIGKVAAILTRVMKPDSLIVSGGSVAEPTGSRAIDFESIRKNGITFALLHLMFRPIAPLSKTMFGENIALAVEGDQDGRWQKWLMEQFNRFGPIFHHLDRDGHDRMTVISQIFHMIIAVEAAILWNTTQETDVASGVKTGGFPCQSIIRSVLRSMQRPDLIAEILCNHPHVVKTLAAMRSALAEIEQAVSSGKMDGIEESLKIARGCIKSDLRREVDWTAGKLIRLEADFRKPKLIFDFPTEMNQPGLLARVMGEFDRLNINKTSTFAHNLPDGGCQFIIGFESIDHRVHEAEERIRSWLK